MSISSIVGRIIPAATAFVTSGGNPVAAAASFAAADKARNQAKKARLQNELIQQQQGQVFHGIGGNMYIPSDVSQGSTTAQRQIGGTTNAGFGSTFGTFLSDVGSNIVGPLSGLFSQVRPFISQQSVGQPALPTKTNLGGQESQSSGVQEGFVGGIPNILGQAARFLRTPAGQVGTGLVGGIGASMLGGGNGGMRITRKMKSQYRAVLNLAGGDYDQAAAMIGVSTDMFIMVLLKRFRNDGPVVTKAALRKTKTTVRRLKSMCDMYDSLRPAATRRRAPMKRATTTLIKN
jgi:hypothetical protein